MARMGRPKLENPRSEGVFIRLTKDEHTDITEYASSHDLTITQDLESCKSRIIPRMSNGICDLFLILRGRWYIMSMSRKDSKGRVLRKGESQRKNDGRYIYQYTDSTGKRRVVYSNDLLELREKEKELVRNQLDGLESYCSGKTTLNYAFDRYISTKYDLKEHTRVNYKYMYNRFVRDTFGKRIINDIKYSDVKFFYCSLMNILGLQANTLDNIHTILHPTFQMAVRDNVIRNNPASGVMAEIKKANGKNKGIRHALTLEQQRAFLNYVSNSPVYCHWLPLFTALFGTGCRIGEMIGLRWEDLDYADDAGCRTGI